MKKRISIIISCLLIVAAFVIKILFKDNEIELLDFLTGLMFGSALALILLLFVKKKSQNTNS